MRASTTAVVGGRAERWDQDAGAILTSHRPIILVHIAEKAQQSFPKLKNHVVPGNWF